MESRFIHYQKSKQKTFQLSESSNKFILRTLKGFTPKKIIESFVSSQPFGNYIEEIAAFPDSRVSVYKCSGDEFMRNEIKQLIRDSQAAKIEYVGTIFQYSHSGVYQIYTGNIYIEFFEDLSFNKCLKTLDDFGLLKSRKIHFSPKGFFCQPKVPKHRNIFDFCGDLLQDPRVMCCHPELVASLRSKKDSILAPNVKSSIPEDWWIDQIDLREAWEITKGAGTKIAVIDDGIDASHKAFKGKIISPRDMKSKSNNPSHNEYDYHGTPCASIATSSDRKAPGVAPAAQLIPIRVTGLGSILQSEAFYWAVDQQADVISCSWGPPDGDPFDPTDNNRWYPLPDHARRAFEFVEKYGRGGKGCPIIFAAGNGNEPAKYDGYVTADQVIAVTSIDHKQKKAYYSDYELPVSCAFPSGNVEKINGREKLWTGIKVADQTGIQGYSEDNYYRIFTGTSASCPGVAGIVALMISVEPNLSSKDVKSILENSCKKVGPGSYNAKGYNKDFGYGLINARLAVTNAQNYHTNDKIINPLKMEKQGKGISLHIGINDYSAFEGNVNNLNGCINDMIQMEKFAGELGYESHVLSNKEATGNAILNSIKRLGNNLDDGDTFFISYSGHGARIEDLFGNDEKDNHDEAWVASDRLVSDDEIHNALAKIKPKLKVIVFLDSCHSQGATKNIDSGLDGTENTRGIESWDVEAILNLKGRTISDYLKGRPKTAKKYNVSVINLSAAKSTQYAYEKNGRGIFTQETLAAFKRMKGQDALNYHSFMDEVKTRVNKRYNSQLPNYTLSHRGTKKLVESFPFRIENSETSYIETPAPINPDEMETTKKLNRRISTKTLLIEKASGKNKIIESPGRKSGRQKEWDEAYSYIMQNKMKKIKGVSPNIISNIYADGKKEINNSRTNSSENGGYLSTYPNPKKYNDPEPFIWHLGDDFSQLRSAEQEVSQELKNANKDFEIKIAQIDTGLIYDNPSTPENLMRGKTFSLTSEEEGSLDKDVKWYPAEKDGHGSATAAILAGTWLTSKDTNGEFEGFFGAIPKAKILPIKISETVVLLSGRLFAKAVDYAIEKKVDVITMSMAGLPSQVMAKAVDRAYNAGIVLISAAGNCWSKGAGIAAPKKTLYPARYRRVIAAVGATYNKTPYRNEYNQTRAAGSDYMQSCYGPAFVFDTTVAAYTPNITWFNQGVNDKEGNSSFVKNGGGTSSATPQIAAAAALYIQKYKEELDVYQGEEKWKKAEIVRQAIFKSADDSSPYTQEYFGQGLIRAQECLDAKYSPDKFLILKKQKPAASKIIFNGALNLYSNRSFNQNSKLSKRKNRLLKSMIWEEIKQLIFIVPELESYQELDLESKKFDVLNHQDLIQKIIDSEEASEMVKQQLMNYLTYDIRSATGFQHQLIEGKRGQVLVRSEHSPFELKHLASYNEGGGKNRVYVDEFEVMFEEGRSSGYDLNHNFELELKMEEVPPENYDSSLLIEHVYEEESFFEWRYNTLPSKHKSTFKKAINRKENRYVISANQPGSRNLKKRLKKILITAFKWVIDRSLEDKVAGLDNFKGQDVLNQLGDSTYKIMVYDLEHEDIDTNSGWSKIKDIPETLLDKIFTNIEEADKVLFVMPGLFSNVQNGFDDFFEEDEIRSSLMEAHSRYVIGVNMPTVIHGIEKNCEEIDSLLRTYFEGIPCTCIARSRGGIVARYLFEKRWIENGEPIVDAPFVLNKMLMTGTPNQGTNIAKNENWENLFNGVTNLAAVAFGTIAPVVPSITTALKAISLGIIDLDGINDLEEDSAVINELNSIAKVRDNYFVVTSDYEPEGFFRRLIDEGIFDRTFFDGEQNDSITPFNGAIFENDELIGFGLIPDENKLDSLTNRNVGHFAYLNSGKFKKMVKKLVDKIK